MLGCCSVIYINGNGSAQKWIYRDSVNADRNENVNTGINENRTNKKLISGSEKNENAFKTGSI